MQELDLLILGAGWTSTFLIPLLRARHLTFAATTRDGRPVANEPTLRWTFDPTEPPPSTATSDATPKNQFSPLPLAKHILITFPLTTAAQSHLLVTGYTTAKSRSDQSPPRFIQLGSTGIWQIPQKTTWVSRRSPYNTTSPRAEAEDELLRLHGCVLNLAGLWGGERDPSTWVGRVAKSLEDVRGKKSLHMVHGQDVARGVLAVMGKWEEHARGQRWMVTDGFVYDWWALMAGWADVSSSSKTEGDDGKQVDQGRKGEVDRRPSQQARWVFQLMQEEKIWALPRSMEALGRCYYGREFWETFGLVPLKGRI